MDSKFCTLICNIDRPVKAFKNNFKGWDLLRSLRILKEFDKTSSAKILVCKNDSGKMLNNSVKHGFSTFFIARI